MFVENLYRQFLVNILGPINPSNRIYWLYLLTSLILAFVAYLQIEKSHRLEDIAEGIPVRQRVGFIRYVFDPKVWFHPSSIQDFVYFLANAFLYYGLIVQFLFGSEIVSNGFYGVLTGFLGTPEAAIISSAAGLALYTLLSVLALDFGVFVMHTLFHRVPILWQFHKVHHSAERLNIMTLFRMHPVDLALTSISVMLFHGIAYGGMFYLTASEPMAFTVLGINVITFGFYLMGYNLRHSHIWLNYPVWLSKILVSPAQHQIHHSSDPKHFDHNMGLIFSFWDQMFGSHYIPLEREKLSFGLSIEEPNPFKSITDLYVLPFVWAAENLRKGFATPKRRVIVYTSALTVMLSALIFQNYFFAQANQDGPGLPSLYMEKLTWTEIQTAIDNGYDRVIIPTGGTEQNGPFVSLGKHNIIANYTSHEIAKKVGRTLIAPVMAYVPEGDIEPEPSGHMAYAGTISLSEDVYEMVLAQTAASLNAHGFKRIFILGESGDSQNAQNRVADRLNREWHDQGAEIVNLDQYYFENGQVEYLLGEGYSRDEIGYHAGMRDMSELMALAPETVRLRKANILAGRKIGMSGNPGKASVAIGKKMLSLKIEAGIKQMREILAEDNMASLQQN